ncbi:MAG: putative peptidoglycan glycosyltransferase FtsW, partial [Bdellovibrionota bacterium]
MRTHVDRGIFLAVIFLIGLGLVQVYSSGYIFAIEKYDDGLYFVRRQFIFSILGIISMLVFAYIPAGLLKKSLPFLFGAAAIGVAATFIPGVGIKVGGAHRWLNLTMGMRFEPSEFLKVMFPMMVALLATTESKRPSFWFFSIAGLFIPLVLVLKQPDFGTFAICSIILFSILFANGLKWRYVTAAVALGAGAFYFLIINEGYRRARLAAFLNPWADPEQKGFQVIQSMLSFYSGGLTGAGLGQGQGKLFFLPEAHTDFTLAVLGEEIGFIGVFCVLMLFAFLIFRGLQVAVHAKSRFQQLAVTGLTLNLALSTFINAGMSMGLLPTKGLAMPFLSYGG